MILFRILSDQMFSFISRISRMHFSVQSLLSQFNSKLVNIYSVFTLNFIHLPLNIRDILFNRLSTLIPRQQHFYRLSEPVLKKVISTYRKLILIKSFVVTGIASVTISGISSINTSVRNNTFLLFHTLYRRLNI